MLENSAHAYVRILTLCDIILMCSKHYSQVKIHQTLLHMAITNNLPNIIPANFSSHTVSGTAPLHEYCPLRQYLCRQAQWDAHCHCSISPVITYHLCPYLSPFLIHLQPTASPLHSPSIFIILACYVYLPF